MAMTPLGSSPRLCPRRVLKLCSGGPASLPLKSSCPCTPSILAEPQPRPFAPTRPWLPGTWAHLSRGGVGESGADGPQQVGYRWAPWGLRSCAWRGAGRPFPEVTATRAAPPSLSRAAAARPPGVPVVLPSAAGWDDRGEPGRAVSGPLQGSPFVPELETSRVSAPSFAFGFWRLEVWLLSGPSVFWGPYGTGDGWHSPCPPVHARSKVNSWQVFENF